MSYIEINEYGAVVEQDNEQEQHRFLLNRGGGSFDSVDDLAEELKKAQKRKPWLRNNKEYA